MIQPKETLELSIRSYVCIHIKELILCTFVSTYTEKLKKKI